MNAKAKNLIHRSLLKTTSLMGLLPSLARKNRWRILLLFILFTAAMVPGLIRIKIDQSMELFFKKNNSSIATFNLFKRTFGSDEFILIMYMPPDGDIFSQESLLKVKALEDDLNRQKLDPRSPLNRITRIRSIISADYLESRGETLINRKFIGANIPENRRKSDKYRELALDHNEYPGSYFSKDSKRGIIQIQTDFGTRLINKKSEKDNSPLSISYGMANSDNVLSTIWTLGLSGWLGITQSMMINIVIFLILTGGIAASIHILSRDSRYSLEDLFIHYLK
jgi:uncharacterized protein